MRGSAPTAEGHPRRDYRRRFLQPKKARPGTAAPMMIHPASKGAPPEWSGALQPPPEGSGVAVGAAVGAGGLDVAVGGTSVAVGSGVAVGGTGVAAGAGVAVGSGAGVAVGGGVDVGTAVGKGVEVGNGVGVGVGVAVGGIGVAVGVGVAVGTAVGVGVGTGVAVATGLGVGVAAPSVKLRSVVITKLARFIAVGLSRVGRTVSVAGSISENSTIAPGATADCCTSMRY